MRRAPCGLGRALLAALLASGLVTGGLGAQDAATVRIGDEAYVALGRLAALGLLPGGLEAERPLSRGRVAELIGAARRTIAAGARLTTGEREDARGLLDRLEARFTPGGSWTAEVGLEVGGGDSPGRAVPENGVGRIDAVVNPLWSRPGGRRYGDGLTAGLFGGLDLALGGRVSISVGARAATLDETRQPAGRSERALERMSIRASLGALAVEVGRDGLAWGAGRDGLLLSGDAPPLDLLRLSSERPLPVGPLGHMGFTLFVADLGPRQNFPHAKLFGGRLELRPSGDVRIALASLNKQLGDGAPDATVGARVRDLTLLWGLFKGDDLDRFSDKLVSVEASVVIPSARGLTLEGEAVLTDFDKDRVGDVLDAAGGYSLSLEVPRLGASGRHALRVSGQRLGPLVYRHAQFHSGSTLERVPLGSWLGPDGARVIVGYGYHAPSEGLEAGVRVAAERYRGDRYDSRFTPHRDIYRTADGPDEVRLRAQAEARRPVGDFLVSLSVGVERVRRPSFFEEDDRTGGAVLLTVLRRF